MGASELNLPRAPRDLVLRAMEAIVRGNPVFQRIVKPTSFRTWSGDPIDAKDFTFEIAPAMRWTISNGPEVFVSPQLQTGDMFINCEILLKGTNQSDMINFWWMLERCFYPSPGGVNNIVLGLQNINGSGLGAHTGLVFFTQPAFDPAPDGVWMAGSGQMRIVVRNDINS